MLKYWQKPFYSFCFELQKQTIVQNIDSVPSVQILLEQPAESIYFHCKSQVFQQLPKNKGKILKCLTPQKAQLYWQVPQPLKDTFALWGAVAYKDILHLDTTTQGASSSAPKFTECCRNNKYQRMLQHSCREHSHVQSPLLVLPKLVTHKTPTLSGRNLNKLSDDNWSPISSR